MPLIEWSHLNQVAQYHTQMAFESLQGWRLHNHSWKPVPVQPPSQSLYAQTEQPASQFVPVASCPLIGHLLKEPGSVIFTPSLQMFVHTSNTLPEPSLLYFFSGPWGFFNALVTYVGILSLLLSISNMKLKVPFIEANNDNTTI